jgi:D-alanine-D-alanine ligase
LQGETIRRRYYKIKDLSKKLTEEQSKRNEYFGENVIDICKKADMVFMALHGENGEHGRVQAAFDLYGIRYTGTGYLGSALAMDKGLSKNMFLYYGIPTPRGIILKRGMNDRLTFPCVVKAVQGGSSVGVYIVEKEEEYDQILLQAFEYDEEVVVEEYIEGREFSVGVLGTEALPVIEIAPVEGFYDYEHKYTPGMAEEICPAKISAEVAGKMQKTAIEAGKALKLGDYYRVDFMLNKANEFFCLEANTLPGMTSTSLIPQEAAAAGVSFEELCEKIIEISMKKYR